MNKLLHKVILVNIFISITISAFSQDVITLKNGQQINAKISDITQTEIKYKKFDYQDGPSFTINKNEVQSIRYANGTMATDELKVAEEEKTSIWNPNKWTNQRIIGIAPFIDLGGFAFTGSRYGLEFRWRRLQVNGFFTWGSIGAMNKIYMTNRDNTDWAFHIRGFGGGYTVKYLFPLENSGSTFHLGIINDWTNYTYLREPWNHSSQGDIWKCEYLCGNTGLGGGYSYYCKNGFFFRCSTYFGITVRNGGNEVIWNDGYSYWDQDDYTHFWGIAEVAIGWEIPVLKK